MRKWEWQLQFLLYENETENGVEDWGGENVDGMFGLSFSGTPKICVKRSCEMFGEMFGGMRKKVYFCDLIYYVEK